MNWVLLKNSLLVGAGTTALAVSFGLLVALCLLCLSARGRSLFLALGISALALPPFLVTNCWLDLLGAAGAWHAWLPLNILSLGGTVWILGLLLWPVTLLLVAGAWGRLEPEQLESDPALSGWALIGELLVPLARSAIANAAVLTFVLALSNFAVPAILQVKVLPAEMWIRFTTAFDTPGVLRMSWPLIVGPLLLLAWLSQRGLPWPHLQPSVSGRLFRRQLGLAWVYGSGTAAALICMVSVGLPVWRLAAARRTWTELIGAVEAGQNAVWNSFCFAAAAASAVVALGLAGATLIKSEARNPKCEGIPKIRRSEHLFSTLLWLPFLLPGVLLGIALITVFNHSWSAVFYQSAGIVILAFSIRYSALGWTTVGHAARSVDRDLIDVARLEGANRWQMLRYACWPQIHTQVVAAWYIVFLLCLWDVESMVLVYPPGGETLALRIFNLLHYGHNAQVNALCLALLTVALLPLCLWKAGTAIRHQFSVIRRGAKHAASSGKHRTSSLLVLLLATTGLPLLICSCSPASGSTALRSSIFDHVEVIGTRGVGIGQLNKPRSVAVDRQDNMYVVDMTGRVQKFSPQGQFLLFWQMHQTDLGKPKGMGRDREGNIIVVEPHYQRLNYFSPAGKLRAQWGEKGTNAGQLIMPRAVALDSRGETFVSEYGAVERVQKFAVPKIKNEVGNTALQQAGGGAVDVPDLRQPGPTARGAQASTALIEHPTLLAVIGHAGTGPGEFNRPEGLCVDTQDRLYVADSCNHRIQIFSSDGKFLRMYGRPGKGKGELSYPYDICVDSAGRQYVCEFGNSRIQVFDAHDQPLEIIGGPGVEPGQFANPWSEALDSAGNLYVADSQNHRVQKLVRKAVISNQYSALSSQSLITGSRLLTTDSPILNAEY